MKHVEELYVKALQFPVCRHCDPQCILEMLAYPEGSSVRLMLLQGKNVSAGIPEPCEHWIKSPISNFENMAKVPWFKSGMKSFLLFEELVAISSLPNYTLTMM